MSLRKRTLQGLDQDLQDHIAEETRDNIERGMSPQEARLAALRKFGNLARTKGAKYGQPAWGPAHKAARIALRYE